MQGTHYSHVQHSVADKSRPGGDQAIQQCGGYCKVSPDTGLRRISVRLLIDRDVLIRTHD